MPSDRNDTLWINRPSHDVPRKPHGYDSYWRSLGSANKRPLARLDARPDRAFQLGCELINAVLPPLQEPVDIRIVVITAAFRRARDVYGRILLRPH